MRRPCIPCMDTLSQCRGVLYPFFSPQPTGIWLLVQAMKPSSVCAVQFEHKLVASDCRWLKQATRASGDSKHRSPPSACVSACLRACVCVLRDGKIHQSGLSWNLRWRKGNAASILLRIRPLPSTSASTTYLHYVGTRAKRTRVRSGTA